MMKLSNVYTVVFSDAFQNRVVVIIALAKMLLLKLWIPAGRNNGLACPR